MFIFIDTLIIGIYQKLVDTLQKKPIWVARQLMILHVLCGIYYLSSDSHIAWKILNLFCGFAFLLATTREFLFRGFVDRFIRLLMVTLLIVDVIITVMYVPINSHELRSFVQQICVISFVYLSMCFDPRPPKKKESLKTVLT